MNLKDKVFCNYILCMTLAKKICGKFRANLEHLDKTGFQEAALIC